MTFPFTVFQIAHATKSNEGIVAANWPFILKALNEKGMTTIPVVVAAVATTGVECHFLSKREVGDQAYFKKTYGGRHDSELDDQGLWKWRGRGYIQLTGKDNYLKYGRLVGADLITHPDLAMDPATAAKILVAYFSDHGLPVWASRGHWRTVRQKVNGGLNGFSPFIDSVWALLDIAYG